jgi:hypothetical protein
MAAKKELFKGLTEILEQLSKKGVKAKTPSVRASRRSLKGARKFEPIADAGSRQPGRKIGEGVPTAGKGRATVKKTTPPIKAQRVDVKAKPKTSRTVGRKKIPMKTFTPIAGAGSRKAGPTRNAFVSKPSTKTTPKRSKITPPVTPPSKLKKGPLAAAIALGTVGLGGSMLNKKDKAQSSPKSMPLPKSKPTPPSKPKATPKVMPKSSGPSTRGSAKKGASKVITAGPNTGFGPKGNIFPGSAEQRKELMRKYGGTGSAAAKAAAAGKQGNLKSSTAKRKAGGKVGIKQIKTKGSVALERVPAKKSSNPSARQVKGFGAARRPKK